MNTQTNSKRSNLKIPSSLLWKAALFLLAVSMIAAAPGPITPGNDGASVAAANCQSMLNSANCGYIETGIFLRASAGSSDIKPDCQQVGSCGYLWMYVTNGGLLVMDNKLSILIPSAQVSVETPTLPQAYNWGIIKTHMAGETAVAQSSFPAFEPNCQIQPYCGYLWMHNQP